MKEQRIDFRNSIGLKLVGILYSHESGDMKDFAIYAHGYRSSKGNSKVRPLAESLTSKNVALFAFDFSGCGESEGKFEDLTITQYIDDLKCAIDHLQKDAENIFIIGNSLGGFITLNESMTDERAKGIVLLSPSATFPSELIEEWSHENVKEWKEEGYTYTVSKKYGKMKIKYSFYEDVMKYQDNFPYEGIKCPVLIIQGTKDKAIKIERNRQLAKELPKAKLFEIKGMEHEYNPDEMKIVVNETTKFIIKVRR